MGPQQRISKLVVCTCRDYLITMPNSVFQEEEFDFCVSFPGSTFDGVIDLTMTMDFMGSRVDYPKQTFLSGTYTLYTVAYLTKRHLL
jgi:hypothetical protein